MKRWVVKCTFPNHEICWRCVIEHEMYVTMNFSMNARYKGVLFYVPCMYHIRISLLIPLLFLAVVDSQFRHITFFVFANATGTRYTLLPFSFFHVCELWGDCLSCGWPPLSVTPWSAYVHRICPYIINAAVCSSWSFSPNLYRSNLQGCITWTSPAPQCIPLSNRACNMVYRPRLHYYIWFRNCPSRAASTWWPFRTPSDLDD